jgi:hypothetical protein
MQQHLSTLHSDSDARFRNELLSNIKHMIGRVRGAISYLNKELKTLSIPGGDKMLMHKLKHQHSAAIKSVLPSDEGVELNPPWELILEHHIYFIQWYLDFILNELIPTSSYQRHITALKALHIILKSSVLEMEPPGGILCNHLQPGLPLTVALFTEKAMRLLLDLLVDPFEDVRTSAASILRLAPQDAFSRQGASLFVEKTLSCIPNLHFTSPIIQKSDIYKDGHIECLRQIDFKGSTIPDLLLGFMERAEERFLRTGRADLADGVAHSYELLCTLLASDNARLRLVQYLVNSLENKITIAEVDLAQAVLLSPVHGYFASLR